MNEVGGTSSGRATAKFFDDQMDGEEVLFVFRKHPVVMRKGLIAAALATLVGPLAVVALAFLRPNDPPSLTLFFGSLLGSFVLAGLVFMPWWIGWHFSVFIVTDVRLIQITQKGLFHRSVVDMGLNQIQMVNYQVAGLQETMLGFGTIMIQTTAGDLTIHDVHKPQKIQKRLLEILRDQGVGSNSYQDVTDAEYGDAEG